MKINTPNVCCIADIHIGVHQNGAQWHAILLEWAQWLARELKSKKIKDILICGDVFHYRDEIAVNTLHMAVDVFKIWKDFNIGILIGNHDSYYKDKVDVNSLSIFEEWPNITIFDQITTFEAFGKKLTFCPWGTDAKKIPAGTDITFGHFEIKSFKWNAVKVCDHGIYADKLLKNSSLVITGHFHQRAERIYDNGKILYVGNPFQMDFGDYGNTKGYYILNIENMSYDFYENTISPKHIKLFLSELAEEGKLTANTKKEIKSNIVRFIIDRTIAADDTEVVLKKFASLNPLILDVDYAINFDRFGLKEDENKDLSGVDIATAIEDFVNMLDIEDKEKVIARTVELYKINK
jgi:DNA repair exonuclease SbcCD nuclease subunit